MSQTQPSTTQVVIVGGGISGLATAFYLQQQAATANAPIRYTLIERSAKPGGKIHTDTISGFGAPGADPESDCFIIEGGPDSFIAQKPWATQLARELGLADRLLGTNDDRRKTFVLNRGKPTPLPDGVLLIVPTRFLPFALSPLISPLGKLRMGLDLLIPARKDDGDETLADFIRRRLGDEALDKIAEPLMSGIYNAEAERQSVMATFPRFRDIERKHGSLIKGMLAARQGGAHGKPATPVPAAAPASSTPTPKSMFITLRGGTQELVETLVAKLTGDILLNTGVDSIAPLPDKGYRLTLSNGTLLDAEQIVLATPSFVAADLVRAFAPAASTQLDDIRYVSTGTISMGFRKADINHPLNGFGIVIPRSEKRPINAITWSSTKFNHRAPDGHVLLRVFFGGSRNPEIVDRPDAEIYATARAELRALMGIDAEPVLHRLYRWHNATPQYDVNHLERIATAEAGLPPGIHLTGCPYRGIGIPDCVHQAQQTAARVWPQLTPAPILESVTA